jgi:glycerol-3-phosphate dehydrogenase
MGRSPADVLAEMEQVAEGVPTASVVCDLAAAADVEVPIAAGVRDVFDEGRAPVEVWESLMARRTRPEVG